MASSGSQSVSYQGHTLNFNWSVISQSIVNNSSTVSWTLGLTTGSGGIMLANRSYSVSVDGKSSSGSITIGLPAAGRSMTVASGTSTITHNSDGTKTFSYSFSIDFKGGEDQNDQVLNVASGSGSGTLNKITQPNPSITSAPNFTDEDNPVVKYSNPVGSSATVKLGIANSSGTMIVSYRTVSATGSSYTFNLTEAERTALRNAATSSTLSVRFYIQSTVGSKNYTAYAAKTMTIVNANPTISGSVVETNPNVATLTGNTGKFVRYYSNAEVSMSATAKKGGVIDLDTLIIRNGSRTGFTNPSTFNAIESGEFTISIADNRGISGSTTLTVPIVEYVLLTCNLERSELDTSGVLTIDCAGNYFNQSFGAVNNTLTVQCRYKPQDGSYSSWMNMSVSKYENTYTASMDITGLNYREKYVIQCRAVDKLNEASTPEVVVKSLPVFHWSENDFVFEVPVIFNAGTTGGDVNAGGGTSSGSNSGIIEGNATIGGDCVINGDLRLKGSGNYGNTLYFGDGSYAMISEPSDDTLTIKATTLNLNGNTVNLNGYPIGYGTWIPTLNNSSAVSSYGVRQGWYSRMGNVITIGWQLKATINSGYSSTSLSISGVPFTPAYAAFGGGVAHNINVSAGFNFEGWTIDTSGSISARMQPCNGTSAGNLQISSSAYYPTGSGNVLTLAGTICYVIN